MNKFATSELQEMEKKLGGYQYLLTFRYANLCIKADPMALLPVTVAVGAVGMNIEELADVVSLDDFHLAVIPRSQDTLRDIQQGVMEAHPEFDVSMEQVEEDDDSTSQFLVYGMPDVDKERRDLLVEAAKSLHDECKLRMDAVLMDEKQSFAELLATEPDSLKEVADALNEKHREYVGNIDELLDKKLADIEDAFSHYKETHPDESADAFDVTMGMILK